MEPGIAINQILNQRYQLRHLLGKKAGRQTWQAVDLQTQQSVVVKLLLFGNDFEWDDLKLFEREAAVLQTLSHPAIPKYQDYFELNLAAGKGFALVQSYIPAKSLEQQMKDGRTFSEAEVEQIARSLLEILIDLHDRQPPVIHRDIKPSNILLANRSGNSPGEVYLVDFGAVQNLAAREGGTMTIVGTYGYMPPEQFGGRAFPASDLYSLGATLVYLVTGQHPADLMGEDLRINFQPFASSLNPAFIQWLQRMTEPERKSRFATAQDALQALERSSEAAIAPLASKPEGSRVVFKPTADGCEVVLPPHGLTSESFIQFVFAIAWTSAFIFMLVQATAVDKLTDGILLALFLLPFGVIDVKLLTNSLQSLLEVNRLQFTPDQVSQIADFLVFRRRSRNTIPRYRISKILLDHIEGTASRIIFQTDAGDRELAANYNLSHSEMDWLAYELNHQLGIPVERRNYP